MERWKGRVAVVTGASSGIGKAITIELVKHGVKVVGVARRVERVEKLSSELQGLPGKLHPIKSDISKEADILEVFKSAKALGSVDILVNNAAKFLLTNLSEVSTETLHELYDTNVIGFSVCTREAIKSMREKGVDDGHIININSVAGQYPPSNGESAIYAATKHAVRVLTEGLRRELVQQKSKIRVTSISPGIVDTEMFRTSGMEASGIPLDDFPKLQAEDIASAALFALSAPPHVQVHELTIRPVGEFV